MTHYYDDMCPSCYPGYGGKGNRCDKCNSKDLLCKQCNASLGEGVTASSTNLCGWCEKKYYDALYERQDLINEYLKAKGRE